MNRLNKILTLAGITAALCLSTGTLPAQDRGGDRGGNRGGGPGGGRGNFDPAQMQERMMENVREQFGVKDDAEWNVLKERVQKVMDARREIGFGGGRAMMFRRPGGDQGGGGDRGRGFGGEPSAAQEGLQKAIDAKASKEELKAAMTKYREDRKSKETKLEAAQDDLKKLLTVPQEAVALQMGLVR